MNTAVTVIDWVTQQEVVSEKGDPAILVSVPRAGDYLSFCRKVYVVKFVCFVSNGGVRAYAYHEKNAPAGLAELSYR